MSEELFFYSLMLVCATVSFLGVLRFSRHYVELKHGRRPPVAIPDLDDRLERIEIAVQSTATEVERISEANRFMAQVLADRAGSTRLASRPERAVTPH